MTFNPSTDDPKDFTASEVTDALANATAEDLERVKILEAQEDGKQRQTVLNYEPTPDKVDADDDGYKRVPVSDPYPAPEGDKGA